MSRYYFNLRNGQIFDDVDGLDLPDIDAVRAEAVGFARDLMRLHPERRDWSKWIVCVTDDVQKTVLDVVFSEAT
jgi:hypothetical protein